MPENHPLLEPVFGLPERARLGGFDDNAFMTGLTPDALRMRPEAEQNHPLPDPVHLGATHQVPDPVNAAVMRRSDFRF